MCNASHGDPDTLSIKNAGDTIVPPFKSDKVTLDDNIPRYGVNRLGVNQPYKVISEPMEFLDLFKSKASTIHGTLFGEFCRRLLTQAILDDDRHGSFQSLTSVIIEDCLSK
ncbi:hypothetical protein BGZ58_006504 [Dissophora ornata]|nr:hypothetical protein BGZ58_006504 [Dissophora ornata]